MDSTVQGLGVWNLESSWFVDERATANGQGVEFSIQSASRGPVNAYPTVPLSRPADFLDRATACTNAVAASSAPHLIRLLQVIHRDIELIAETEPRVAAHVRQAIGDVFDQMGKVRDAALSRPPIE